MSNINNNSNNKMHTSSFGVIDESQIHNIPLSLQNKPKPNDNPTKKLVVYEAPDTPDTTVLGLEAEDLEVSDKNPNENIQATETQKKDIKKIDEEEKAPNKTESESAFGNIAKVDNNVVNHKFENKQLFLIRKSNGEKIVINKDKFVIGKSKFSDYQVRGNSTVSRSHIIVTCQSDGSLIIEDNNSKNGTFVDGIRVGPHERFKLEAGQSLRLSDEIFDICDV